MYFIICLKDGLTSLAVKKKTRGFFEEIVGTNTQLMYLLAYSVFVTLVLMYKRRKHVDI